jgi:serine/threonine protein kinase
MSSDAGSDPRIGALAGGKYRVLRLLGNGGMGTVYEAQNVAIGKRVALKFVTVDRRADPAIMARFHREALVASSIESSHIVQVFDTGETDEGEPFLVMELLSGEDLASCIARRKRLPVDEAVMIITQTLRGLVRAHAAGIVHRDLKPDNLFLASTDDGQTLVKIVDFGLSKIAKDKRFGPSSITELGSVLGTPLYMSPEQFEGRSDVDQRADLWSIGAILYEALSGSPPFVEPSYPKLMIAICTRDPVPIEERVAEVPQSLARVVRRALERDRERRFRSADELLAALTTSLVTRSPLAASIGGAPSPIATDERRTDLGSPFAEESTNDGQPSGTASAPSAVSAPSAELKTYTAGASTLWLSQPASLSIWRGEVAAPDRLRIEGRDGALHELRLEPIDPSAPRAPDPRTLLKLGRTARVGEEVNDLVYTDVASRLAATVRHDGVRFWLKRRDECSVPVQVGARPLHRGEEAPLVHGTFVSVGGMRATFVDRRYMTPTVPAGAIDPTTGLLARAGLEQETAAFLQRGRAGALVMLRGGRGVDPASILAAIAVHRAWPSWPIGFVEGATLLLCVGDAREAEGIAKHALEMAANAGLDRAWAGYWILSGEAGEAGREIELSLTALDALTETRPPSSAVVALREVGERARLSSEHEIVNASVDQRRTTLLFAIEEQAALGRVGPHVVAALEQELTAVVATHAGGQALIAPLSRGIVAACITKKQDASEIGSAVQCDWHGRAPVTDGKAELPRTLSWEILHGAGVSARAAELSRECSDPHGVLSSLAGGLPYPIAGRVHAAIASSSSIERVKMLFDVLEGTWRFIATVLVSAVFARRAQDGNRGLEPVLDLARRVKTREGYALGTWRELARAAARCIDDKTDPIAAMAREVVEVKLAPNQTFETLSNLMQVERNGFAHGHYSEARAVADLGEFEQMTRTLLRALRPLCAWTLVTVEKTEPDLYGEVQAVEFIDHTGPFNAGTRRRIGLNSPVRLANVVYLARWREGLVLPLEPMVRRVLHDERYELYWMDHLPRAGRSKLSCAVGGGETEITLDARRLPPLMRALLE